MSGVGLSQSTEARPGGSALDRALPRHAWWLPGPHLPTVFAKLCRYVALPGLERRQWPMPDGDSLSVARIPGGPGHPRLIVFHGLEGGERSSYARKLLRAGMRRSWGVDLVLWRTCDGQMVNGVPRSYHSGASDDAGFAIETLLRDHGSAPVFLVGVSLGGNVLLKWLGEKRSRVPAAIQGAAVVSVPYDLAAASRTIEHVLSGVYGRIFLKSLKAKAVAKARRFPGLLDPAAIRRVRTLWEFDDVVTAPLHGFADAADYYARSSSIGFLSSIRVPTLLLNAENDPFLPRKVLNRVRTVAAGNAYLHCEFPKAGGHVGFVSGLNPLRPNFWMEDFVLHWLQYRGSSGT